MVSWAVGGWSYFSILWGKRNNNSPRTGAIYNIDDMQKRLLEGRNMLSFSVGIDTSTRES